MFWLRVNLGGFSHEALISRTILLTGVLSFLIGYGLSRYLTPQKTVTVEKVVKVIDEAKNIHTVTTITERPQEKITKIEQIDTSKTIVESQAQKSVVKEFSKPNWIISGEGGIDYGARPIYGASISHRFISNLFMGLHVDSNSVAGIISLEF